MQMKTPRLFCWMALAVFGCAIVPCMESFAADVEIQATIGGGNLTADEIICATAAGNRLFLTDRPLFHVGSFRVLEISNLIEPELGGYHESHMHIGDFAVEHERAYVTHHYDFAGALSVYDINGASTPTLRSRYSFSDVAAAVAVDSSIVYVAAGNAGFFMLDATNPTSLTQKAALEITSSSIESIALAPDQICLSVYDWISHGYKLHLLDRLSRPDVSPKIIGSLPLSRWIQNAQYMDGLLYVPDGDLRIVDCHDAANPRILGQFLTPGNAFSVSVSSKVAFVMDSNAPLSQSTLLIIDVSDPENPKQIGSFNNAEYEITGRPSVRDGRDIFLPTKNAGVLVLRYTGPLLAAARPEWTLY